MALITLLDAQLAFGHVALLDHASFSLEANERVGLIGRNGAGKSSLLKILGGLAHPDDGVLQVQQGLRIAYVPQEPVLEPTHTIFEAASTGLSSVIALREQLREVSIGCDERLRFTPHLTLVRKVPGACRPVELATIEPVAWTCERFVLVCSRLTSAGSDYSMVAEFPLASR